MGKTKRPIYVIASLLVLVALACNRGTATPSPATEAAQTVEAILTASAGAPPLEGATPEGATPGAATEVAGGPSATPPAEATLAEVKPSDTPAPTNTSGAQGCADGAEYVADVTVPDDTVFAPGTAFTKTWRLRNTGTCTWVSSYSFAFIGGESMGGPASVSISGNVAPGSQYDVSVNLVAPSNPGTYKGTWQMRNSGNAFFGTKPFVQIVVAAATPTATVPVATSTATVTATSSGGPWSGIWETDCGAEGCGQMNLVQTGNTVVGTYAGGAGTINGTVNGNLLTGTWSRGGSSGTIDFWLGSGGQRWRGNFNKTAAWCGQRSGLSAPSPCGLATWYGAWTTQCGISSCGDMNLTQNGGTVTGNYAGGAGSVDGSVNGTELTGTWTRTGTSGSFKFFMVAGGQQFQGNWETSNEWCGYRSGSSAPAPCIRN